MNKQYKMVYSNHGNQLKCNLKTYHVLDKPRNTDTQATDSGYNIIDIPILHNYLYHRFTKMSPLKPQLNKYNLLPGKIIYAITAVLTPRRKKGKYESKAYIEYLKPLL